MFSRGPPQIPTAVETSGPTPLSNFVTVSDGKFMLNGNPYYFVGANFWQGMNLGVDGPGGDRELLVAELDRLQRIGVTNLRVMAASEGPNTEPFRMVPALMVSPGVYDEHVLDGLDFFIAEIGKREMKAVMVLNNTWQWSGGMGQYVFWIDETAAYIKSLDPNHLVTTGSEGMPPGETQDFQRTHDGPHMDYATVHIWPQNWDWYDPRDPTTYEQAEQKALEYLRRHVFDMVVLNKPLVLEEFGRARDWEPIHDIPGSFLPGHVC